MLERGISVKLFALALNLVTPSKVNEFTSLIIIIPNDAYMHFIDFIGSIRRQYFF